ncbi:hypothetical protein Dimus_012663 [Dionaea muscipula]
MAQRSSSPIRLKSGRAHAQAKEAEHHTTKCLLLRCAGDLHAQAWGRSSSSRPRMRMSPSSPPSSQRPSIGCHAWRSSSLRLKHERQCQAPHRRAQAPRQRLSRGEQSSTISGPSFRFVKLKAMGRASTSSFQGQAHVRLRSQSRSKAQQQTSSITYRQAWDVARHSAQLPV